MKAVVIDFDDALNRYSYIKNFLEKGKIIAVPTESSYGLCAIPTNQSAVEKIFHIKGREETKPLPVIASNIKQIIALGCNSEWEALETLEKIWPAPLTAIVPITTPIPASKGKKTLAVRIPAHRKLRKLLDIIDTPLTATSCNRSGLEPIFDPEQVKIFLQEEEALVIDGGVLPPSPPSTIIEYVGKGKWKILREGSFDVKNKLSVI